MEGQQSRRTVAGNAEANRAGEEEVHDQEQETELGQAAGDHGAGEDRESNTCCICHEPWASCGAHRICCIPCGHVYGRSCLETWLIRSGGTAAKCLLCGEQFKRENIINLYGTREHLWDDDGCHEQAARQQIAMEDGEAPWQVSKAAMDAMVADLARQRVEISQHRLETIEENLEIARKNLKIARGNSEMARRNDRAGVAAISMFAVTILLIVAALFSRVL